MQTIRESILRQSERYPGGIDAVHVQRSIKEALGGGAAGRTELPRLAEIEGELEALKAAGLLVRLDDAPGASLPSTRIYAKPGTYPQ